MDLDSLRGFVLVATEGSIAQAAPRMYLSVSALSRRLKELERQLGVVLFDRTSRGLVINAAGQQLLDYASGVIAAADELNAAVARLETDPPVRLGLCPGIDTFVRRTVVGALETTSRIPVRPVHGHNIQLIRQLGAGQLDMALLHQDAASARIRSVLIRHEPTTIMFADSLPQAGRQSLSLRDFAGQPFVTAAELMSGAPVYYARLKSILAESGINEVVDVGNAMWIRDMVASGSGFAIFAGSSRAAATEPYGLQVRQVRDLDLDLETYLAWPTAGPTSRSAAVVRFVLDSVTRAGDSEFPNSVSWHDSVSTEAKSLTG